jgi:hypothetical protein
MRGWRKPGRRAQGHRSIAVDLGRPWFLSGSPHAKWNNDGLRELRRVKGSDFEAVDVSSLMLEEDSGQARQP